LLLLCLVGFAGLILIQLLLGALIGLIGEEVLNVASELLLVPVASGLLATGLALVFAVLFFQLRDLSPVVETIAAEGLEPTLSATG
jgi:ABC-type polysaccharide/polyol phosphate export permease